MTNQPHQEGRGTFRGRGGRGGVPRRAAAEYEHTVVRGRNYGKQIVSTVVYQSNEEVPETSYREEFEFALKENPPDEANSFGNRNEGYEVQMMENGGQPDKNDLVMGDHPCS